MNENSKKTVGIAFKAALVAGLFTAALAAGCSEAAPTTAAEASGVKAGATDGKDTSNPSSEFEGFKSLHPQGEDKVYFTGFDGTNDYVAPVAFLSDEKPEVTIGDPSVAELKGIMTITKKLVEDLPDVLDGRLQLVLVKSLKAGETTVTGTSGSIRQKATLKVTQYGETDVEVGRKRYEEGSPSCKSCHGKLGVHNPTVLVDLADETILGIAVDGKSIQKISTETGLTETLKPNKGSHTWNVTSAERTGLMAYLRSRSLTFQRY